MENPATTVGELIEALKLLPVDMPLLDNCEVRTAYLDGVEEVAVIDTDD